MSFKPNFGACLAAGLAVGFLGLSACSAQRERASADDTATVPAAAPEPQVSEPELTATEAAVEMDGSPGAAAEGASAVTGPALNPTAPKSYTVKRGDTLWDISALFLREPWLWPEVWYVNPQVANPHLIYPGDVLALAYGADGRVQIRLERGGAARLNPRLRSSELDGAIPAIPYSAIAAFLARPTVLSAEDVKRAPHVVAFRDGHMVGGTGHEAYVSKLDAPRNARFSVIHVGAAIRDPDDGDLIGYQGTYTATALVTQAGDPAKTMLGDSARETLRGDRLFASDTDVPLNFVPRAPREPVEGRIISVVDGVELIGQYQIVVVNRGRQHGLEIGHVLAVDQAGEVVRDRYRGRMGGNLGNTFAERVKLPDERAGTLLVFKTFDRISYALVVGASGPMRVQDVVRNP